MAETLRMRSEMRNYRATGREQIFLPFAWWGILNWAWDPAIALDKIGPLSHLHDPQHPIRAVEFASIQGWSGTSKRRLNLGTGEG
jgi:hypothetical protein